MSPHDSCPHVLILLYTGHSNDEVNAALIKALDKGTSFGAPSLNENVLAQMVRKKNMTRIRMRIACAT